MEAMKYAAERNLISQGMHMALHREAQFSWQSLLISTMSAGISNKLDINASLNPASKGAPLTAFEINRYIANSLATDVLDIGLSEAINHNPGNIAGELEGNIGGFIGQAAGRSQDTTDREEALSARAQIKKAQQHQEATANTPAKKTSRQSTLLQKAKQSSGMTPPRVTGPKGFEWPHVEGCFADSTGLDAPIDLWGTKAFGSSTQKPFTTRYKSVRDGLNQVFEGGVDFPDRVQKYLSGLHSVVSLPLNSSEKRSLMQPYLYVGDYDVNTKQLLYVTAYNENNKRIDYIISPQQYESFRQYAPEYMIAAGNAYGVSKHLSPETLASANLFHDLSVGAYKKAVGDYGRLFKAGLKNPNNWLGLAGGIGGEIAGGSRFLGAESGDAVRGLGANPFNGKTFEEIDNILESKGFIKMGPDPANGRGSYFHPNSGRKYYLDKGGVYKEGIELPHVDVHRMKDGANLEKVGKHKYPLGDKLIEEKNRKGVKNVNF